ncbi:Zinc finger MYM-type protein 1 [Oopsacas minuta]|uniref:Zinc finger MYM-type protein 1 n=1 Tax=Oopsacas minuta TaxID=111878 RepID=A0AAV7K6P4_9METZ|nr:Zinc finger MYM-type protein 1 [Oopsacas minuta]
MHGKHNALHAKVMALNRKAFFTNCVRHQLNVVCQDATRVLPEVVHTMEEIGAIISFIRHSSKRLASFEKMVALDSVMPDTNLRPLCETRPRVGNWIYQKDIETLVDIFSADGANENTAEEFYQAVKDKSQESNMKIDLPTLPRSHAKARFRGKRMELEITEEEITSHYAGLFKQVSQPAVEGLLS